MTELPIRRVLWVLLAYGAGAAVALPVLDLMQRVLALPPLFAALARAGLALGVPLAIAVAWRYPQTGERSQTPGDEGGVRGDNRPESS